VRYREVLRRVVQGLGVQLGFVPSPSELDCLADSLKDWRPFPDTVEALQALKRAFKLAIISNIDDDLFALSAERLKVEFDWVITAEQARSYKPSPHNFRFALQRIGISPKRVLHIAQSIYHDIVPAKAVGLSTVWVNRRSGKEGFGATPSASGRPDLEVPDLRTLVSMMGL
ncbi:MAG: HAD-IA family hydrolase, partial [Candidatus Bipolaricaulia bacterium]